jgi:oxygen-dependent protoporphyrinogen oxidase
VHSIRRVRAAWKVILADGRIEDADQVVLAVSGRVAAGLVSELDPELAAAIGGIVYSGVNLVALAFSVEDVPLALDGYGYLVTRPERLATLGVVWESSLFSGRAPSGTALLRVFLGGTREPDATLLDGHAAVRLARRELARVMHIRATPARVWTFRWPDAIAQYTVGHLDRVAAIRNRLRRHQGLDLCGASYDGVSFNHAIASGRRRARSLAAGLMSERASRRRSGSDDAAPAVA